jgi:tetratricopeptide (TPR) repeat protein
MIGILSATDAQTISTKKARKQQTQETKMSRFFIEGQKYLMIEDFEKAYFFFSKARDINPQSAAVNYKLAEILLRANQVEQALNFGNQAVRLDPSNKYYNLLVAEAYTKKRQPEKAAEILENLMSNPEENQGYILDLASLYLGSGNFDKALITLNKAEDYYGVVEPLIQQKQRIYLRRNDLKSAVEEGKKLIDAHPGNSQYVLSLVEILFNNGKTADAIDIIEESLRSYPGQPDLEIAAYTLYKEQGKVDTAEQYIKAAFENPELDAEVKAKAYVEILTEIKTSKRDSLLDHLQNDLLTLHSKEAIVQSAIGEKYLAQKEKLKALSHFQTSIEYNPTNAEGLQNIISIMLEDSKDFTEVETYTIIATEEFPELPEFWFYDGAVKSALKKNDEAKNALLKALETNKSKNKAIELLVYSQLGDVYFNLKEEEKSFEFYEKVLKEKPDDEHVLNNYAYFLSLSKKDLDKAKNMSERLVKRFPKNSTYLDTHAWVLFQLKDYEGAKKFMELAIEHDKDPSGVMWEHYGDILYHLGKKNEALSYWKKADGKPDASEELELKIKNQKYYD